MRLRIGRLSLSATLLRPDMTEEWVTADDQRIHIADMTEDHAKNSLAMIVRHAVAGATWQESARVPGKIMYTYRPKGILLNVLPVAQPEEQRVSTPQAGGSNPSGEAK